MRRGRPPLGERSGIAERASMYMDASLAAQLRTYMSMYQVFNKAEALRQLVVFALERTLQTQDGSVVTPKQIATEKQRAIIESAEMLGEAKPIFIDHIGNVYPIPYYKPSTDEDDPNSYVRECPICNSTTDIHDDGGISWWCDSCRWSGTFVHKADDTYELKVTHKKKTKVA
jgi:hemin uptake protein HemP/ribosomal protein L37AE/L43A